jgi:hypothetical protein
LDSGAVTSWDFSGNPTVIGGTLTGSGTIDGPVEVTGTLAPRSSSGAGTIQINGDLIFTPTATLSINLVGDGKSDSVAVTGNVTAGSATIDIQAATGYTPGGSLTFTFLTWGGTLNGSFRASNLPSNGPPGSLSSSPGGMS